MALLSVHIRSYDVLQKGDLRGTVELEPRKLTLNKASLETAFTSLWFTSKEALKYVQRQTFILF